MTPRFGDPRDPNRHYRRRPGVYAILVRAGRVLLTHQSRPLPEFQLPGGGIDAGEAPLPALTREVQEETGWRIGSARRLGCYRRFTFMPEYDLWAEKVCTIYLARPSLSRGAPSEPHHTAHWVPLAQAAGLVGSPGDAAFLRALAGDQQAMRAVRTALSF